MIRSYKKLKHVTLGSQLRIFADMLTSDAATIYNQFDLPIDPKWFPVFYVLASEKDSTVTSIASTINHSHVSVSKIVSEMDKANLTTSNKCRSDSRRTLINLSAKGNKLIPNLLKQVDCVDLALSQLFEETGIDFWEAFNATRRGLTHRPLSERTKELTKATEFRTANSACKRNQAK